MSSGTSTRSTRASVIGTQSWGFHAKSSPLFAEYLRLAWHNQWGDLVVDESIDIQPTDALVIVDMQNDFVPAGDVNPHGGAFAVAEGDKIAQIIVSLMKRFASAGALVVPTRDYHPIDHCSFMNSGGPFPAHCVQGSIGSHFYEPIGICLKELREEGMRTEVVFKGFHEDVDSFGSFMYEDSEETMKRVCNRVCEERLHGCSLAAWTGCVILKCSNAEADVNAPPDVLAAHRRVTLADRLRAEGVKRVFACGLALDFCVLDTCLNGSKAGFDEVFMVLDAARAAHLPGIGHVGTGFLHDHAELKVKLQNAKVKLVPCRALIPDLEVSDPNIGVDAIKAMFPEALGPMALKPCTKLKLSLDFKTNLYLAVEPQKQIRALQAHGLQAQGSFVSPHSITLEARTAAGIPEEAVYFLWANPVFFGSTKTMMQGYFSMSTPSAAFLVYGGFVYLDAKYNVVNIMCLTIGDGLCFRDPVPWRPEYTKAISSRFHSITIGFMTQKGAKLFAWVNPQEALESDSGGEPWVVAEHGAFVYMFNEDMSVADERNVFFAVNDAGYVGCYGCR